MPSSRQSPRPRGVGFGAVLAAVATSRALEEAWRAGGGGDRVVLARALRDRAEPWCAPLLVPALDGTDPEVRDEALLALGRIGTPRARRAILDRVDALWDETPLDLLGAAHRARLTELLPRATAALDDDDPVIRWAAARLVTRAAPAGAAEAILRSAEGIASPRWRRDVTEVVDEIGHIRRRLRPVATRPFVLRSPLVGVLPLTVLVGAPRASAGPGRPFAPWTIRTRYAPLRFSPRLARGDDRPGALRQAMEEAGFAVAGSHEAHEGWITHPDGTPLEPQA